MISFPIEPPCIPPCPFLFKVIVNHKINTIVIKAYGNKGSTEFANSISLGICNCFTFNLFSDTFEETSFIKLSKLGKLTLTILFSSLYDANFLSYEISTFFISSLFIPEINSVYVFSFPFIFPKYPNSTNAIKNIPIQINKVFSDFNTFSNFFSFVYISI